MVEWSFHLGELGGFLNWTTDFKYFGINKQHEEGKLAKLLQSQHRKLRNTITWEPSSELNRGFANKSDNCKQNQTSQKLTVYGCCKKIIC